MPAQALVKWAFGVNRCCRIQGSLLRSACSGVHPMGARCESFLQDTRFHDSGELLSEPFRG